mgnify:CR=1 FL=1|tara:strand:+ start:107 stop:295 length:189 start_codon:yes stop_codon:yes gene_type:complete
MKYALSFCFGALLAIFVCPPQPSIEMDSVQQEIVIQEVLDRLEENGYSITEARRDVQRGWFK